ncbi:hypothetical protein HYX13_05525, partial [Candidatus Woesearchaeota archaeon]|nr:hypothetical protein [Candidatus Woesearchaeota archaeon]
VIDNVLPIIDRQLTGDDFYFLGAMLGDGYSGAETREGKFFYKGSSSFTSADEESISCIENISRLFENFTRRVKRSGSVSLVISKKKWFREFLCRCGIELGEKKYIHPLLMQAELNLIKGLIQGLFDTDGYVQTGRNVGFSNISIDLIKNLQKLLLRYGIVSRMRKRPARKLFIIRKIYQVKEQYELTIAQEQSILLFYKHIGFRLERKQKALEKLVEKLSQILFSECKKCNYKIYADIFTGRTQKQREWGVKKEKVIKLLGKQKEVGSREINKQLGFFSRHAKGNRLNHHYQLISKRRIGNRSNTEQLWSLNNIGKFIYEDILKENKAVTVFLKLLYCPLCKNKLHLVLRKNWRNTDFDGDIFWDYVRKVKEVDVEKDVYDVVLPDRPKNDHLFIVNGFVVHNSAGLSLPAFRVIITSLKRFSATEGMHWIPVLEYLQMAGRAGRPEYESFGEAIALAKSDAEHDEIHDRYIQGVPEEIYSKLAVEPVLRTYLLSLVASGIIRDKKSMMQFFSKTFWAHQFKDMRELERKMNKMLHLLEEWQFIRFSLPEKNVDLKSSKLSSGFIAATELQKSEKSEKSEKLEKSNIFEATLLGKRVSELYLDPLTARHLLDCLLKFTSSKNGFSLLQMISHTLEMRPLLRTKKREEEKMQEEISKRYSVLLEEEPSPFHIDYTEFVDAIKTALFFEAWTQEKDEEYLLEVFDVRPGEIKVKMDAADWLLYASDELAKLLELREVRKYLAQLRLQIQYGVKEELLPLIRLKGIGRVRARKLFAQGIRDLGAVKNVDATSLAQILGSKILSEEVKKQVGEEINEISAGKRVGQLSMEKFQ